MFLCVLLPNFHVMYVHICMYGMLIFTPYGTFYNKLNISPLKYVYADQNLCIHL